MWAIDPLPSTSVLPPTPTVIFPAMVEKVSFRKLNADAKERIQVVSQ
jgi:hypothetical protein